MLEEELFVPTSWKLGPLASCVEVLDRFRRPVNSKERANRSGDIPYYGATGQVGWIDNFLFDEELVLIGEDGAPFLDKSKPIAYLIEGKSWVNNHAHVLRARPEITSNAYIKYYMDSFDFRHRVQGSTRDKLTQGSMNTIPVLLAPRAQQDALVNTLQTADSRRQSSLEHIDSARRALDRFRQAVFAAACSGRLTADWREEHSGDAEALADSLLARTAKRRRPTSVPEVQWLAEDIPATWVPVTLGCVVEAIEAGKSVRAHGHPAGDTEWGVIKVSAMSWGRFLPDENKALLETSPVNPDYEIREGDLLISRANTVDLVGATVLVGPTRRRLLLSDKSLRLVTAPGIDRAWLNFALRAPRVREQFEERATGTSDSMRNLSQDNILMTTLSLPPSEEQAEIARRIEALLRSADDLVSHVEAASRGVDRSSQAILAKAFRGGLSGVAE